MKIKLNHPLFWVWKSIFNLHVIDENRSLDDQADDPNYGAEPEPEPEPDDLEPEPEPEPDDLEPEPEPEPDDLEPEPEPRQSRGNRAIAETRKRAQEAENRVRQMEQERAEEQRQFREFMQEQQRRQQGPSEEDKLKHQEDQLLADPTVDETTKWTINANRRMRQEEARNEQARREVARMQFEAANDRDRGKFEREMAKSPKLFDQYEARVEQELDKLHKQGRNAPRMDILRFLIGEDALKGASKPKTAGQPKSPATPRGKTPGVRSDVTARGTGSLTEAQKREKRLENERL